MLLGCHFLLEVHGASEELPGPSWAYIECPDCKGSGCFTCDGSGKILRVHPILLAPVDGNLIEAISNLDSEEVADGLGHVFRVTKEGRSHYLIPCVHNQNPSMARQIAKCLPETIDSCYLENTTSTVIEDAIQLHELKTKLKTSSLREYMEKRPSCDSENYVTWRHNTTCWRRQRGRFESGFVENYPETTTGFEGPRSHFKTRNEANAWNDQRRLIFKRIEKETGHKPKSLFSLPLSCDEYITRYPRTYDSDNNPFMCNDPVTYRCSLVLDGYLMFGKEIRFLPFAFYYAPVDLEAITTKNRRNKIYADGIDTLKPGKTTLSLLGAAHFYGDTGVLNLLKNRGWTLSRVPCTTWQEEEGEIPEGASFLQDFDSLSCNEAMRQFSIRFLKRLQQAAA